jgi:hypothetical protein
MNKVEPKSPRIARLSWGQIGVEGHPPFRDAKVFPGGARAWDWQETGTRHVPGIQPADVQELVEHGAMTIVLSKGHCQTNLTGPAKGAGLRRSGCKLTPLSQGGRTILFEDVAGVEVAV